MDINSFYAEVLSPFLRKTLFRDVRNFDIEQSAFFIVVGKILAMVEAPLEQR